MIMWKLNKIRNIIIGQEKINTYILDGYMIQIDKI